MEILSKYLKNNPLIKNIIFDFDDTLVSLQLDWENFMQTWPDEVEGKTGIQFPEGQTQMNHPELVNALVKKYGREILNADRKIYENFEEDSLTNFQVNDRLIEFIKDNTENLNFYIWSSNTRITIETILNQLQIFELFKKIVSRNDVEYVKPDNDGFAQIANKADSDEDTFLFVGNDLYSDKGAATASMIEFFHIDNWEKGT
jgi:FMN phosphatase YigB (HAD superfamily)